MSRSVASAGQCSISLVVVYAPQDTLLRQELENHLSLLKHRGFISLWSVDKIIAGNDPTVEIERHLNIAHIILLLISADFFADELCNEIMMRSLQIDGEEHARVIPIILRPVDWETSPISTLQVLPTNGKPVTTWSNRDDVFLHIVKAVRKIVLELLNPTAEHRTLTESDLHYLNWLIKHTSSLDTRGIYLAQRPFQVNLEEIYIALNARHFEDVFQEQRPSLSPDALTAGTSEQTHVLPLSGAVSRHDHLMILGEPGSGKTTFLRYLALKHAQAFCEHRDTEFGKARFPILLRIADYVEYGMHEGKSLSEYLASDYIRHECPISNLTDVLKAHLQTGTCLVLLDGLDEVVHANDRRAVVQYLEEFIHRYEDFPNRFIITSRHAGYREVPLDDTFAHYTLQELDETHIWHFLESWCLAVEAILSSQEKRIIQAPRVQYEVDGLKKAIQTVPGVRRLATNPLYLRILAQLHRTGAPLPQQRVALYDQITNTLTQTWRTSQSRPISALSGISSLDQSSITRLLSRLAYWLHLKKSDGFASEREIYRELGKEWARLTNRHWQEEDPYVEKEVQQFLRAMRDHTGILVEDTPHHYGFAHLTFEEYYAACYLVANNQEQALRIRTHLHDPHWQEPILLALGLIGMQSPDEACILIKMAILAEGEEAKANILEPDPYEPLLGQDYFFVLRCMGDGIPVHTTRAEQLIERLIREITQQTGSGRFQKYQEALAEGLGYVETSIYASIMLPHLINNIESPDYSIRIWSLYSLGRIGRVSRSEKIRLLFLDTLRDEDPRIRSAALWGLSTMPGSEITATLLHILSNDSDASMRSYAVKYLGERRKSSPQVIKALIDLLHDAAMPGILLRNAAIESLGQLGDASPSVISALIALLGRDILLLSDKCVLKTLQQLSQSSSEVVPMMVDALQSAAPRVRIAVAKAIETFGHTSLEAITTLREVPSQRTSIRVPQVPFCVKQWYWLPHQIEAWCLYMLRTASTRWEAVKTLGQLEEISERAESALLVALSDEDTLVRSQAVKSLNTFEKSSEVLSVFINVLSNDSNASVRAHIVECLGEIDQPSEGIVQALLKAMYDTEEHVRTCAVKSLGHIAPTSPKVLTSLLFALLNDDFFGARWEIVRGFIHRKELPAIAVPVIVHALSDDKHAIVREDCAHLLGQAGSSDATIIQVLLKGLYDTDIPVRKTCAQTLVQLGQRFPEWRETITVQLLPIIQEQQNDTIGHCAPCDVAYDALWHLVNDGSLET